MNARIDLKHLERKLKTVRKYYDFQVSLVKFWGNQFTTEFVAPQANSYLFTRISKTAELPEIEYQNCREILIQILFQVCKTMNPEDRIRLDDMEIFYNDMLKKHGLL
ncbi:hypothetical protein [Pediococcus cellicola]|uniref:hypothetical protein n=1 Tax=Pediococcus cellicola TaxID=319652 RepID=UPI000710E8D8|nr:hypothetical protein [Pediococcus cellicola]GEL15903.1 hypothetical protein PCE01_17050 [Pediococcus cellicola]